MAPAGLGGLYSRIPSSPSTRNIIYRDLHNHEIKLLATILRGHPVDPESEPTYWANVKDLTKELPSNLRSSALSRLSTSQTKDGKAKEGKLCAGHAALNAPLIHSIFHTLRSEIDHRLGAFLFPVLMFAGAPQGIELRLRQLEPVGQMWRPDFDIYDHTLPGRQSLTPTERAEGGRDVPKWREQRNGCAACMLARLGSDKDVQFALMAAMVGCYSSRALGKKPSDIKSKRVRFVRYWLKKFGREGEKMAEEAWELGKELRRLRRSWKEQTQRNSAGGGFYGRFPQQDVGEMLPGSPVSQTFRRHHDDDAAPSTRTASTLWTPIDRDQDGFPNEQILRTGRTAAHLPTTQDPSPRRSSRAGLIYDNVPARTSRPHRSLSNPSVHSETASIASESVHSSASQARPTTSFGLNLPRPPIGVQRHPDGLRGMYRAPAPAPLNIRRPQTQRTDPPSVSRNSIYAGFQDEQDGDPYDSEPESPLRSRTPVAPVGPLEDSAAGGYGESRTTMWSDFY